MPSLFAVLMMRTPVHVAAAVSAVPRNVELVLYVIHFRQSRPYAQISPRLAMSIFLTFSMFMLLVRSSHRHHFFFLFLFRSADVFGRDSEQVPAAVPTECRRPASRLMRSSRELLSH